MQIWLDTINLETIASAQKMGILSGITTNPGILSQAKNVPELLRRLLDAQSGPVAVQVTCESVAEMIMEGQEINQFSKRLLVKVPVNQAGLMAMPQLRTENIPILGTAVLTPSQALLAANIGANYIAPYFSRMGDNSTARQSLQAMVTIFRANHYHTKILVASVKTLADFMYCALIGADVVTIKEDLYYSLIKDDLLLAELTQKFLSDWNLAFAGASLKDLLTSKNQPAS